MKCKECGRELLKSENDYCVYCRNQKDFKKKKKIKIGAGIIAGVGLISITFHKVFGKKGSD